jgi:small multidrug resistance family-3 protein
VVCEEKRVIVRSERAARNFARTSIMRHMKTFALYVVTAIAEIAGCYFPYRWLKTGGSPWLVVPGALSLALFAWLLTLHDTAAGRIYAAYGGVYIGVAIAWLWAVDRIRPTAWDLAGAAIALVGMGVIAFQPRV